jgi:3-oxoadipate enol-lactonase
MRKVFRYPKEDARPAAARLPPAAAPERGADRFLAVAGARLRFRDEGRGPAVVLVHGWTLDLEMWESQVAALRDTFRVVRFDRRGHGLSSVQPGRHAAGTRHDAADLAALCRHLGLERVALLGMSQGVRALLDLACAAPERVRALILDGPPAFDLSANDPEVPLARYRRLVMGGAIEAFRHEWARHPLMHLRTRAPAARRLLATMIARYRGDDLAAPIGAGRRTPVPRLESLRAPTLILNGAHDLESRARASQWLLTRLPGAEYAVIPNAGHLPSLDNPAVYNALCRAFLNRHA